MLRDGRFVLSFLDVELLPVHVFFQQGKLPQASCVVFALFQCALFSDNTISCRDAVVNILLARLDWRASPTWALARRIGESCWLLGHVGHEHLAKWSWRSIKLIPGLPDSVQPAQAEQ